MKWRLSIAGMLVLATGCGALMLNYTPRPQCLHKDDCDSDWCCKDQGQCGYSEAHDTCVPRTPDDCLNAKVCGSHGRCGWNQDAGICEARNDQDCQASFWCKQDGRCKALSTYRSRTKTEFSTFVYGSGDRSTWKTQTRIRKDYQRCVAHADSSCVQSEGCALQGDCAFAYDPLFAGKDLELMLKCAPANVEHCAQSTRCKTDGEYCEFKPQSYEAEWYQAALARRALGGGGPPLIKGECYNDSDAACRRSKGCRERGQCYQQPAGGFCVARDPADCKASKKCVEEGHCTLSGTTCDAADNADCRGSKKCRVEGACTAVNGWCHPVSDAECRGSTQCKAKGLCAALEPGSVDFKMCMGSSEEDCQAAAECPTKGRCHFEPKRFCLVSVASCQASAECRSKGLCVPSKNRNDCVAASASP